MYARCIFLHMDDVTRERKTERLNFTLEPSLLAKLVAVAAREGHTVSSFVRHSVAEALREKAA